MNSVWPGRAERREASAHEAGEVACDREAEAGAGDLVARDEALEDARRDVLVDSRAVVGDDEGWLPLLEL